MPALTDLIVLNVGTHALVRKCQTVSTQVLTVFVQMTPHPPKFWVVRIRKTITNKKKLEDLAIFSRYILEFDLNL